MLQLVWPSIQVDSQLLPRLLLTTGDFAMAIGELFFSVSNVTQTRDHSNPSRDAMARLKYNPAYTNRAHESAGVVSAKAAFSRHIVLYLHASRLLRSSRCGSCEHHDGYLAALGRFYHRSPSHASEKLAVRVQRG